MKSTILVVDDFENTLFVTGFSLERAGYNVLKAKDGKEALNLILKNKIDLIISDYNMPIMNGLEFIQRVKQNPLHHNIPVFILSTEIKSEIKQKAYSLGVTAWIPKPFKIEDLVKKIAKAL